MMVMDPSGWFAKKRKLSVCSAAAAAACINYAPINCKGHLVALCSKQEDGKDRVPGQMLGGISSPASTLSPPGCSLPNTSATEPNHAQNTIPVF